MCLLGSLFPAISHLRVLPVALATIFAKALPHVLPLLLPAMHVCPFVATCVPKLPLDLPPVLYFSTWICQRSVATNVAITFAFAIHVALNIAAAIATAITLALMVCHGYCHHV